MSTETAEAFMLEDEATDLETEEGIQAAADHANQQPLVDREFKEIVSAEASASTIEGGRAFTVPSLQTLESIREDRERRRKAAVGAGYFTLHKPDFHFRKPDLLIHRG